MGLNFDHGLKNVGESTLTRRSFLVFHLFGIILSGDAINERCDSRTVCGCCCGSTYELRHAAHRGYSSIKSQIMSDASVPPTEINDRSPYKNRTLPIAPEYDFVS